MPVSFRVWTFLFVVFLSGCPLGTPYDHSRAVGHGDIRLAVSPDGTIVFNGVGEGGRDLYRLDLQDGSVEQVLKTPDYETAPDVSPDGEQIVYGAGVPGDRADHLFVIARDGTGKRQLTKADFNDAFPRFSPDGQQIVFARDKTYVWGGLAANWDEGGVICVINVDGTGERQLTPDEQFAYAPFFSVDGKQVLYSTFEGLFSVPLDRSEEPTRLGPIVGSSCVTQDGTQIIFADGTYAPDYELYIADLDGQNRRALTESELGSFHPVLATQGDRVYFVREIWPSGATGVPKFKLWTVALDGADEREIAGFSLFESPLSRGEPQ